MSWSLQIKNGDLSIDGARLTTVTGFQKLVQDMRVAVLTKMGSDELHPEFGSLIDGGTNEEGMEIPSLIGSSQDFARVSLAVESEIRRIGEEYQNRQMTRARNDQNTYGKSTIQPGEALMGVGDILFYQAQDKLLVQVELITALGRTATIAIPLGSTSNYI